METTIFDRIIQKEIPAEIVYEDEYTLAFLDRNPIHKGHTLVAPKERCRNVLDCSPEAVGRVYQTAQKIAQHMQNVLKTDGVNIHNNNEPAAGQEVMYFHVHVIPRYNGLRPFQEPTHEVYEEGEMQEYAQKLRGA